MSSQRIPLGAITATLVTLGATQTATANHNNYYEARNRYTNNSETILLCNTCVCNWKINSQTINVCRRRAHRKYLMKAPNYTNEFLPESPV